MQKNSRLLLTVIPVIIWVEALFDFIDIHSRVVVLDLLDVVELDLHAIFERFGLFRVCL